MKKTQIPLRPTKELKDKLQIEAKKTGISVNALIIIILQEYFK